MNLLPFLISGLGVGAAYALSGVGLVLLFRATGVLNFAFGAIGAFGAHVAWAIERAGAPLALAILGGVATSTLLSFLYGRLLAPKLAYRDMTVRAVGTLGMAMLLLGAIGYIWGEAPRRLVFPTDRMFLDLFDVRLTYTRIIALLLAFGAVALMTLALVKTRLGLAMRSLANDRDLSGLLGVKILSVETAAWLIAGVFAGFAGLLLANLVRLQGLLLTFLVIPAISAAILARLTSLWIAAIGGLAIGVIEASLSGFPSIAPYRTATPFVVALIAVSVMGASSAAAGER